MTRERPEILAPAGDRPALEAAVAAGADAVYFGLPIDPGGVAVTLSSGPSKGPGPPALWLRRAKPAYANAAIRPRDRRRARS